MKLTLIVYNQMKVNNENSEMKCYDIIIYLPLHVLSGHFTIQLEDPTLQFNML